MFRFILFLLLVSCASTQRLYERGLSKQDRKAYVEINYESSNEDIKDSFIKGNICLGMPKRLIINLIGPPINITSSYIWKYPLVDKDTGYVEFEDGVASKISKNLLNDPKMYN